MGLEYVQPAPGIVSRFAGGGYMVIYVRVRLTNPRRISVTASYALPVQAT